MSAPRPEPAAASDRAAGPALRELAQASLARPVDARAAALAARLAARPGVAAALFYGACLREPDRPGLPDFYLLTDGDAAYHGPGLSALANRLLPPNVYHVRLPAADGAPAQAAKVAVISLPAFEARMRRDSLDTTLWARFAQPAALVAARDAQTAARAAAAVARGLETAAWWADRLAPGAQGAARWAGLFGATYGAELRAEGPERVARLLEAAPDLYAALDAARPPELPSGRELGRARRAWARRRLAGKALNVARLVKAAFTFRGGPGYLADKVMRHAGPTAPLPARAAAGLIRLLRRLSPR